MCRPRDSDLLNFLWFHFIPCCRFIFLCNFRLLVFSPALSQSAALLNWLGLGTTESPFNWRPGVLLGPWRSNTRLSLKIKKIERTKNYTLSWCWDFFLHWALLRWFSSCGVLSSKKSDVVSWRRIHHCGVCWRRLKGTGVVNDEFASGSGPGY